MILPEKVVNAHRKYQTLGKLAYYKDMNSTTALDEQYKALTVISDFAKDSNLELDYVLYLLQGVE